MLYIISIPFILSVFYNLYRMKTNIVKEIISKNKIILSLCMFLLLVGINYYLKGSKDYYILILSAMLSIISCILSAGISEKSFNIYKNLSFIVMSINFNSVDHIEIKEDDVFRVMINAGSFRMVRMYSLSDKEKILGILKEKDIKYTA